MLYCITLDTGHINTSNQSVGIYIQYLHTCHPHVLSKQHSPKHCLESWSFRDSTLCPSFAIGEGTGMHMCMGCISPNFSMQYAYKITYVGKCMYTRYIYNIYIHTYMYTMARLLRIHRYKAYLMTAAFYIPKHRARHPKIH